MKKKRIASIIVSIIVSITIIINGLTLNVSAADNLCHKSGDHANVWKLLSYDGKEHTYCWHCDICNIDYIGDPGQEFDTRKTSVHYSATQTVTPFDEKSHRYGGTCDECHQTINYGEDHNFDVNGICTVCKYNKNDPSNGSGSGNSSGGSSGGSSSSESSGGGNSGGSGGGSNSGEGSSQKSEGETVQEEKIVTIPKANELTYNGQKQIGVPAGTGYTISDHENTNAGTYYAKATLNAGFKWSDGTKETKTIEWTIKKAPNPGKVKYNKTPTVKYSKLQNSKQKVPARKMFQMIGAVGKITYSKTSGNKKISINKKTGELVLKKGLGKGTYKIKIKVSASGDKNYLKGSKTVNVRVKVK